MTRAEEYKREQDIKQAFMQDQYECPVCEATLDVFVSHTNNFEIKEEARCPNCAKLIRKEDHILH